MKRYLIEFNTDDDKEVSNLVGALLMGGHASSLKVQVFTEEELQSGDANTKPKSRLKVSERRDKVFKLKQQGLANRVIAKKLDIAANTVGNDLTYWRNEGYDI
jgi:DNA-binding NarL/FixJ family response regulator